MDLSQFVKVCGNHATKVNKSPRQKKTLFLTVRHFSHYFISSNREFCDLSKIFYWGEKCRIWLGTLLEKYIKPVSDTNGLAVWCPEHLKPENSDTSGVIQSNVKQFLHCDPPTNKKIVCWVFGCIYSKNVLIFCRERWGMLKFFFDISNGKVSDGKSSVIFFNIANNLNFWNK